jgi:hypothetical protein
VFRLSHALISIKRMLKVSAAQFLGWTSLIAIFLAAPNVAIGQHVCGPPVHSPSIRRVTHRTSSACGNKHRTIRRRKARFHNQKYRKDLTAQVHKNFYEDDGLAVRRDNIQFSALIARVCISTGEMPS